MRDTSGCKELAESTFSGREPTDSSSKPSKLGLQEVPPTPNRDTWWPSMGRGFLSSGRGQISPYTPPCEQGLRCLPAQASREGQTQRLAVGETTPGAYSRWDTARLLFLGGRWRLRYFSLKILRNLPIWWRSSRWDHPCWANPKWKSSSDSTSKETPSQVLIQGCVLRSFLYIPRGQVSEQPFPHLPIERTLP